MKTTKTHTKNPAAVALGRLGGLARTAKKAAAARENGKKGGRPKGSKNKPKPGNGRAKKEMKK